MESGIGILRVSGEDQKKGYGWDVQQEHIEAFAEGHSISISMFVKFQERATTLDREEFEAILEKVMGEARRGSIQWVLFGRANRLNRHDWTWMEYLSRLFRVGLKIGLGLEDKVVTAEACQDPGFVMGLVSDMVGGAQEAKTLRVVSIAARKRRAKDGRLPTGGGGLWPYFYIPGKKPGQGIRETIPERAEWCRRWLEWLRQGVKGNEIARRMNKAGVPPPKGNTWWTATIFGIMKNEALRGKTEV